jgi:hypothetical protein
VTSHRVVGGLDRRYLLVAVAALFIVGCGSAAPRSDATDRPTQPPSVSAQTTPPENSAADTPVPQADATPNADQPAPVAIEFAKKDGSQSETFKSGTKVWLNATIPTVSREDRLTINVYNGSGELLHQWEETVGRGKVSSRKATFTDAPGTYLMQYLKDGVVVAEGTYTLTGDEAVEPDPTRTPKPDKTPKPEQTRKPANNGNCDPSYPTLCLRSSPDLNCDDIGARRFPVRGRDPHNFDGDGDGIGCESD